MKDQNLLLTTLPKYINLYINHNLTLKLKKILISIILGTIIFKYVLWVFAPSIVGFAHYRPVISIDGTYLYGKYKGKLLIAMAIDANNEIFFAYLCGCG